MHLICTELEKSLSKTQSAGGKTWKYESLNTGNISGFFGQLKMGDEFN